jgi:nicotinamidase-related amidase
MMAKVALDIEPARSALVVIDLQKGIVARPCEPHAAQDVIANAARVAAALRAKGGFVVPVRVAFSPDHRDALRPPSDEGAGGGAGGLPADWSDLVPGLGVQPGDHVVTKRQWGAFHGTDLDLQLRRRGITTILLCGISTSIGVESTARYAFELGYAQVFLEDAMSSRSAAEHEHTVQRIFPRIGRVRSTAEVLAALG